MRIKSIFFSITILFIFSTLSISLAFFFFIKSQKIDFQKDLITQYRAEISMISDIRRPYNNPPSRDFSPNRDIFDSFSKNLKLKDSYLKEIENIDIRAKVLAYGDWLIEMDSKPFRVLILEFEERFYIYLATPFKSILLEDSIRSSSNFYREKLFFIFIISIFIISYIIILKKIYPLKVLKESIDRFADGDFDISFELKSDDEISDVAKAFQRAVIKIDNLIKSRQLFLRNIMHELKTPITKGKFAIELLESDDKNRFFSIFNRMENLIRESSSIEQITSGELKLEKKEYRIIDILDEAIDISMQERDFINIEIIENPKKIEADFSYIAIAFKNLIDNAIKYSNNKIVDIKIYQNRVIFINSGEALKREFKHYLEAFSKEKSQGLGLGLYITDSIIKLHKFKLNYSYRDDKSIFEIVFFS